MMKIDAHIIKRYNGKLFLTEDAAATAFGCEALPMTAVDKRERGAIILPVRVRTANETTGRYSRVKLYTYGSIFSGGHNNVIFDVVMRFLIDLIIPRTVSFTHTHPFCTGHKPEVFSPGDELVAKLPGVRYMYLASPGGCLYKYDGGDAERNEKGELILKKIDTALPRISDRWDCRNSKMPKKTTRKSFLRDIKTS